ncbi:hypothetical protein ACFL4L_06030 [bacterium]
MLFFFWIFLFVGCTKQVLVPYHDVEKNNWITATLDSGEKIEGNVLRAEPHLITIRNRNGRHVAIEASRIQKIKRIPPEYDDFGIALSEDEINKEKTNKNATIYGIGGGLLSFGASFFVGSMIAQKADDGGTVMAAVTGAGGILGTTLFVQAGKRQDRKEAVQRIRGDRNSTQIMRKKQILPASAKTNEEKKKLEDLRRQREKLLRELEKNKKNNE